MAKYSMKKSNRRNRRGPEPATTTLTYEMPVGTSRYIDLFADLSKVNRKLIRQGHLAFVQGITVTDDLGVTSSLDFQVRCAGNNWITHNAWTKGHALWNEMNKEVLESNPSVQGSGLILRYY